MQVHLITGSEGPDPVNIVSPSHVINGTGRHLQCVSISDNRVGNPCPRALSVGSMSHLWSYAPIRALGNTLLKILGHGLPKSWNCSPDVFDSLAENPAIPMRMLHYAAQPVHDEKQFGVGAHTDFGSVTILLQQLGTKGLEVWYPPTETWIPVPPKENTFVINMGDFVDRYTNRYYRSARHRVITTDKERYSVAFFFNRNVKLKAPVLDGSGGEVNLGDHIRQRAIATCGAAPTLIESKV